MRSSLGPLALSAKLIRTAKPRLLPRVDLSLPALNMTGCIFHLSTHSRRSARLGLPAPSFCVQPFFQPLPPPPLYPGQPRHTTAVLSSPPYRRFVTHPCSIKTSACCTRTNYSCKTCTMPCCCCADPLTVAKRECYRFYFCTG